MLCNKLMPIKNTSGNATASTRTHAHITQLPANTKTSCKQRHLYCQSRITR